MEQNEVDYFPCLLYNLQLINISEIIYQIAVAAYELADCRFRISRACFPIALAVLVLHGKYQSQLELLLFKPTYEIICYQ